MRHSGRRQSQRTCRMTSRTLGNLWLICLLVEILCHIIASSLTCPANCSCVHNGVQYQMVENGLNLFIKCNKSANNETAFVDVLDKYLDDVGLTNITHFTVSRSPLSSVTPTICQLTQLQTLSLDGNKLRSLPVGCFSNMTDLSVLTAYDNRITELRSKTFNGLKNLQSLGLSQNLISHIDVDVFVDNSPELELISLSDIDLSKNQMYTIDAWPLVLSQKAPHRVSVNLDDNKLSQNNITNHWNYTYKCGMPAPAVELSMKGNLVTHLAKSLISFGMETDGDALCFFINDARIDITRNHLICDCEDIRVYVFFKFLGVRSVSISTLQCSAPPPLAGKQVITVELSDFLCDLESLCPIGCTCQQRPVDLTIIINCENNPTKTEFLPELLPSPIPIPYLTSSSYQFELMYKGSGLTVVDNKPFFHQTRTADFSGNRIINVTMGTFEGLDNVELIYLHDNRISRLDRAISDLPLEFIKPQGLSLHKNPWICDCHSLWLKHWLVNITDKVRNTEGILCGSPKRVKGQNLLQLEDKEFICGDLPDSWIYNVLIIVITTIGGAFLLIVVPYGLIYKFRVGIYAVTKWHPFDKDECDGEGKVYDVFVSYSDYDEDWVMVLVTGLEEIGYTVCIHKRDFYGGRPILTNIGYAIAESKRTLCILSDNYLRSNMCVWEFTEAFNIDVEERKHRLLVVRLKELSSELLKDTVIQNYIRTFSYVANDSKYFFATLLYSLPIPRKIRDQVIALNIDEDVVSNTRHETDGAIEREVACTDQSGYNDVITPLINV